MFVCISLRNPTSLARLPNWDCGGRDPFRTTPSRLPLPRLCATSTLAANRNAQFALGHGSTGPFLHQWRHKASSILSRVRFENQMSNPLVCLLSCGLTGGAPSEHSRPVLRIALLHHVLERLSLWQTPSALPRLGVLECFAVAKLGTFSETPSVEFSDRSSPLKLPVPKIHPMYLFPQVHVHQIL